MQYTLNRSNYRDFQKFEEAVLPARAYFIRETTGRLNTMIKPRFCRRNLTRSKYSLIRLQYLPHGSAQATIRPYISIRDTNFI